MLENTGDQTIGQTAFMMADNDALHLSLVASSTETPRQPYGPMFVCIDEQPQLAGLAAWKDQGSGCIARSVVHPRSTR